MIIRLLLLVVLASPVSALAVDLSSASDAELSVLAADPDWGVRVDAALELSRRADPDLTQLRLELRPRATRAGFLRFTTAVMNTPEAAPALLHRLRGDEPAAVRGALADSLSRQSAPWADAVLELLAEEPDASVRAVLVHSLRFVSPVQAQETVALGLSDADPTVRAEVARLIARRADGAALSLDLRSVLGDPDPDVRAAAAQSLGALRVDARAELQALLDDPSGDVRLQALRALHRLDPVGTRGLASTRALVTDVDARVARKASRILAD